MFVLISIKPYQAVSSRTKLHQVPGITCLLYTMVDLHLSAGRDHKTSLYSNAVLIQVCTACYCPMTAATGGSHDRDNTVGASAQTKKRQRNRPNSSRKDREVASGDNSDGSGSEDGVAAAMHDDEEEGGGIDGQTDRQADEGGVAEEAAAGSSDSGDGNAAAMSEKEDEGSEGTYDRDGTGRGALSEQAPTGNAPALGSSNSEDEAAVAMSDDDIGDTDSEGDVKDRSGIDVCQDAAPDPDMSAGSDTSADSDTSAGLDASARSDTSTGLHMQAGAVDAVTEAAAADGAAGGPAWQARPHKRRSGRRAGKEGGSAEAAMQAVMSGAVAGVVFRSAVAAVPRDMRFRAQFLAALQPYRFTGRFSSAWIVI